MRPLRLSMTAFGPYAGTEVIDFDELAELGLFVVAGKNGAGKTTIFDALHYCLFGTLPGRRASYVRLKSDHATDRDECQVCLDFVAHGTHWRVERSPKQARPKRRGTGVTQVDRRASLARLDHGADGPATMITNRIGEVDQRCRELVGLSGAQFERVALLPQGQFSRVLTESGTDRRSLLRTLFSSEVFSDATALLTEQAAQATAADRGLRERLEHQQASLARDLYELTGAEAPNGPVDLAGLSAASTSYRSTTLARADEQASEAANAAALANDALRDAMAVSERVRRRDQIAVELNHHAALDEQHQIDRQRLRHARAAIPVASQAEALAEHTTQHSIACQRITTVLGDLLAALDAAGLASLAATLPNADTLGQHVDLQPMADDIESLLQSLADHAAAAEHAFDTGRAVARIQGDLRKLANELRTTTERRELAERRHRQAAMQLDELAAHIGPAEAEHALRQANDALAQRQELASLDAELDELAQRLTQIDTALASHQHAYANGQAGAAALADHEQRANHAIVELEACQARRDATVRYEKLTASLASHRQELQQSQRVAQDRFDAFITGTAARLADTLTDGEPCPVCGSAEHPHPASPPASDPNEMHPGQSDTGSPVTEQDLVQAQSRVEAVQRDLATVQAEIQAIHRAEPQVASFTIADLDAELDMAKAAALSARSTADEARHQQAQLESLAAQVEATTQQRTEVDQAQRNVEQRRNRLHGAMGDRATIAVADLHAECERAQHLADRAHALAARQQQLTDTLEATQDEIDTLGLHVIAADQQRASAGDLLIENQRKHQRALNELITLTNSIQSTTARRATADRPAHADVGAPIEAANQVEVSSLLPDREQRRSAARRAHQLVSNLGVAVARRHDAHEAMRRATSLLHERLAQSPFDSVDRAIAAALDTQTIEQLDTQIQAHATTGERLRGLLEELGALPETAPDLADLQVAAERTKSAAENARSLVVSRTTRLDQIDHAIAEIVRERSEHADQDLATQRLERVAAIAKGDNERNVSLENWVLAAHLRNVVELANLRLARSTHQRFQLCVLDDGENKRGKWGLDLGVEDSVTGTQRPTAGLSGGELFQASLALALGLADAVMNQTAGVRIDALFIDEGFGSLDETSVERAIDLLDELRDRGALVGVITHVPALLHALPLGVHVGPSASGAGSTIRQDRRAA